MVSICYFNYPFIYTVREESGDIDNSKWYPDMIIFMSFAAMAIMIVPLYTFIYIKEVKIRRKKGDLIINESEKEKVVNLTTKAANALINHQIYSAASYCFSANTLISQYHAEKTYGKKELALALFELQLEGKVTQTFSGLWERV